jgi:hypothetical protein
MGIDLLTTRFTRPDDLLPVVTCQAGSAVGELEPFALTILRDEAHDAIALQATAEVPPALLGRLPHLCTVVPTVHKLMGVRCLWWCEGLNLLHRQVDLALEGYLFLYHRRSLAIEGCR